MEGTTSPTLHPPFPGAGGFKQQQNLKSASSTTTKQKLDVLWHSETVTYHGESNLWDKAEAEAAKNAK